jgi:hypothetical protein
VFTLQKPKSKGMVSARQQINIQGTKDGILLLPGNQYRVAMEVSAVNFELKSEDEQDSIIDTYESFLNSLPCPLQILVRIRELDMSQYLTNLRARLAGEKETIYQTQLKHYSTFVQSLVADNMILSRHFFVILPFYAKGDDAFDVAKERLSLNSDIVAKGLMRLGMHTRQLDSLELLDLFHSFYSPDRAKRQPITEQVVQLINSEFVQGDRS